MLEFISLIDLEQSSKIAMCFFGFMFLVSSPILVGYLFAENETRKQQK